VIHGYDLSRFDGLDAVQGDFVILNVEDPGFGDKVARAVEQATSWGVYQWIYPGEAPPVGGMHDRTTGLGHGEPPVGYWADFEQVGCTPDLLDSWFGQCDAHGLKAGYYSGPTFLDHSPFLSRAWWCAAYPGTNDGSYPGVGALWPSSRPRPMQLWQFTSTNGTLDQDSVEDPEWWAAWLGTASTPTPATTPGGKSMEIIVGPTFPNGHLAILVDNGGRECERWTSDGTDATEVLGIPKAALDWHNAGGRGQIPIVTIDAGPFARFLDNLKATTGDQPPGSTPEQLAAVQAVKAASTALAAAVAALG
jgi:hypothetical protein